MKRVVHDSGWAKQLTDLMKKHVITIGIHDKDSSRDGGDLPNAQIGYIHEWGLGNNPKRSFLRSTADEKRDSWLKLLERAFKKVAHRQMSARTAFELIGNKAAHDVVMKINSNIPPELSEATKDRKGKSTALIDTGQLKNSIDFEIKEKRY